MIDLGESTDVLGLEVGFVGERHLGRFAHHQVSFDFGAAQQLQDTNPVDSTGRAGDADDQPARWMSCHPWSPRFSEPFSNISSRICALGRSCETIMALRWRLLIGWAALSASYPGSSVKRALTSTLTASGANVRANACSWAATLARTAASTVGASSIASPAASPNIASCCNRSDSSSTAFILVRNTSAAPRSTNGDPSLSRRRSARSGTTTSSCQGATFVHTAFAVAGGTIRRAVASHRKNSRTLTSTPQPS